MQFEALKAHNDSEIMSWANQAIEQFSNAAQLARGRGLAYSPSELRSAVLEVGTRISALADRGRLFFPNEEPHVHGAERELAFKGFRPVVLDCLVFSFYELELLEIEQAEPDIEACEFFTKCRRLFVSEIQNSVDPRRRGRMLKELGAGRDSLDDQRFKQIAVIAQDLERRHPGTLAARHDVAWVASELRKGSVRA
jgi:hypothetical protein